MARPVVITQSGTGQTPWQALNINLSAFHVGVNCSLTGSATYNVEVTNSDFLTPGTTVNAFAVVSAQTTAQIVAINTPARAWRINQTAGSGSVTAEAVQAGLID